MYSFYINYSSKTNTETSCLCQLFHSQGLQCEQGSVTRAILRAPKTAGKEVSF